VVSKSELLEHCWEASAECDPAVVEVLVHRLRRKIEAPGGRAVVETLRGEGDIVRTDSMGREQAAASVQYKVLGFRTDAGRGVLDPAQVAGGKRVAPAVRGGRADR
jgi:Transcriptional regulatory protein, C terminal